MGKPSSKGKYVVKVGLNDIYVLATKKPDTTKKHGYSMTYDFRIYKNGKLVEKGLIEESKYGKDYYVRTKRNG